MLYSPDWKQTLVPNHQVCLQCPTTKCPCSAQPPSVPVVPNHQVSLQCPTTKYPCSAQPPSVPVVPNHQVSLQCPTTKCPCSAQPPSVPGVPNHQVSLECPTTKCPCSAQPPSIPAVSLQCSHHLPSLNFSCHGGFRVGMLEVNIFGNVSGVGFFSPFSALNDSKMSWGSCLGNSGS